jgi:thioesterase domain-containing protein
MREKIQQKIRSEIPVADFMNFQILDLSLQRSRTRFPLAPNVNHLGTAFGGSLFSAGALSCYSLVLAHVEKAGLVDAFVVISKGEIEYLSPGRGDFRVEVDCEVQQAEEFQGRLKKGQKAPLKLEARIVAPDASGSERQCARFLGSYLVKAKKL